MEIISFKRVRQVEAVRATVRETVATMTMGTAFLPATVRPVVLICLCKLLSSWVAPSFLPVWAIKSGNGRKEGIERMGIGGVET